MSLDQVLKLLDEAGEAVHAEHPDAVRLEHLDAHLATARMVVEHIYDEAARAAGGN